MNLYEQFHLKTSTGHMICILKRKWAPLRCKNKGLQYQHNLNIHNRTLSRNRKYKIFLPFFCQSQAPKISRLNSMNLVHSGATRGVTTNTTMSLTIKLGQKPVDKMVRTSLGSNKFCKIHLFQRLENAVKNRRQTRLENFYGFWSTTSGTVWCV